MSKLGRQVAKTAVSGGIATVIDVTTLIAMVEFLGVHVTLAAFLSAGMGGVANFFINKYWAFRDRSRLRVTQVAAYSLVSLGTGAICAATVHILSVWMSVPYLIAKTLGAFLAFAAWSYPAQSRIIFRKRVSSSLSIPPVSLIGSESDRIITK